MQLREWISAKKELPPNYKDVLIRIRHAEGDIEVQNAFHHVRKDGRKQWSAYTEIYIGEDYDMVTHWSYPDMNLYEQQP